MATIQSLVGSFDGVFDDATTEVIGAAFDAVCLEIGDLTGAARLLIAHRIMDAALGGERDPVRLRDFGRPKGP